MLLKPHLKSYNVESKINPILPAFKTRRLNKIASNQTLNPQDQLEIQEMLKISRYFSSTIKSLIQKIF